jgi:hypothetical protein
LLYGSTPVRLLFRERELGILAKNALTAVAVTMANTIDEGSGTIAECANTTLVKKPTRNASPSLPNRTRSNGVPLTPGSVSLPMSVKVSNEYALSI